MYWNHRVFRRYADINGEPEAFYTIHEVYYNEANEIVGYIESEKAPFGNDLEELRWDCRRFLEAVGKPVIDIKDLEAHFERLRNGEESKYVGESGDSGWSNLY